MSVSDTVLPHRPEASVADRREAGICRRKCSVRVAANLRFHVLLAEKPRLEDCFPHAPKPAPNVSSPSLISSEATALGNHRGAAVTPCRNVSDPQWRSEDIGAIILALKPVAGAGQDWPRTRMQPCHGRQSAADSGG